MNLRTKKPNCLRRWELALMLGLALSILAGVWLDHQQTQLSDKVIRLHVIANSDSDADQALKLLVRDAVLQETAALLPPHATAEETLSVLGGHLDTLAQASAQVVRQAGRDDSLSVSLENDVFFPTKQYDDFSLPAGHYRALRVVIGDGGGKNWWCVVFPPLCLGSVSETVEESAQSCGFSRGEISLVTGETQGYIVKFKAIELWERFKEALPQ